MDDRTALMSARALAPGYDIMWYTIEKTLGQGGFGITYLARDNNLDKTVAIKEYLPVSFAYRHQDFTVKPITGAHGEDFSWGLKNFLNEARTLAKFSHSNIVRVSSFFELNNTAYMVMEYERGENLAALFKRNEPRDQRFFESVFFPIFSGLDEIHRMGFIHRDIKPANIYIREDQSPVLLDFGSARETIQQSTGEMTTLVSQGYTPLEQYSANYGEQGPWTDIYALAATMYEGITGSRPEESLSRSACLMRSRPDTLADLTTMNLGQFDTPFLAAVMNGLSLDPDHRPRDLRSWRENFDGRTEMPSANIDAASSSMGFTELDDRTRLRTADPMQGSAQRSGQTGQVGQPITSAYDERATNQFVDDPDFDFARSSDPVAIDENEQYDTSGFRPTDKPYANADDLGIDDLGKFDTGTRASQTESQSSPYHFEDSKSRVSKKTSKKRKSGLRWMVPVTLVAGLAGAGYFGFQQLYSGPGEVLIDQAYLNSLPAPSAAHDIPLPSEQVVTMLNLLSERAGLYGQLDQASLQNPSIASGLSSTYEFLDTTVSDWNLTRFPEIRSGVQQVLQRLPQQDNRTAQITNKINQGTTSTSASVLSMIKQGSIARPIGASVLDHARLLDESSYTELTQHTDWKSMMETLKNDAINQINDQNFEAAVNTVQVALLLDPEEQNFLRIREHLTQ